MREEFTTINVCRTNKSFLKHMPANLVFDSRSHRFLPNCNREFTLLPGELTIIINQSKKLNFNTKAGQKIDFIIKESIYDWKFLLKYFILFSIEIGLIFISVLYSTKTQVVIGGAILTNFFLIFIIYKIKEDYFYIEQK